MDLIVTHNNADFDAFSSLVAAKKLYPKAKLLLPGSQERAVREFLSLVKDKIVIEDERTCDFKSVKRLIIVDTRHRSRIGRAAEVLDRPSTRVHIYDHHPRALHDIKAQKDIFQEVGATVSILIDILRKQKKFKLTPLEATIMLLAIYEETGSLTYRTTTRLDVDTVSFLLSKGANLQAISSYLNRKLTEEELTFLTLLISSTKVVMVNGVTIAIAEGTIERFIGELGMIVRKLHDVENFPVLFVLFKIRKKLRVIARSRLKEVDVNKILKHFGGAGHRSAASVRIDGGDSEAFKEKLLNILRSSIKVRIFARDIMTRPVKTIKADKKIREAKNLLRKLGLKGMPVIDDKSKLIGMITIDDIRKALRYRYGHASVKGYMSRVIVAVKPNTPLHTVQKIMFEKGIGRVPVMRGKKLLGIVTRTDVLKSVHRDIFVKHKTQTKRKMRFTISGKMKQVVPSELMKILREISHLAFEKGYRVFVVGGFVRDMLLGVKNFDLDIVVEGNAILFGKKVADFFKGSFVAYKKFGTSSVIINWPKGLRNDIISSPKFKIDFATARKESYEKPAALPTVEFSSIKDDLQRRDFTINAMAASINRQSFGQLIDFFGGEKDLDNGVIRVLHDGSFIDDPTRIFRAVRFEQRFSFHIDRYTASLIQHAVKEGMFLKTQHHRIRDEIILMLREKEPLKAIKRMGELHELRFIHKKIKIRKSTERLFENIRKAFLWYDKSNFKRRHVELWLVYLMALLEGLDLKETEVFTEKFGMRRSDRIRLISLKKKQKKVIQGLRAKNLKPSKVYALLEPCSFEEILFIKAKSENKVITLRIGEFFKKYNQIKLKISGKDLKKMGVKPGPAYKKLLKKILHEKIDRNIRTKRGEIRLAEAIIKRKTK